MLVLRPVELTDLEDVYTVASYSKAGLTTLPYDRKILKERIEHAVESFKRAPSKPGSEIFLFVLEDTEQERIAGTSAIFSKIGGFEPSYTYKIHAVQRKSKSLGAGKTLKYLKLHRDYNGPSEIATLFLLPEYRKRGAGRLLAQGRFLFMAQYPDCFENEVIAELRGVILEGGYSPFWEAVGRHFFHMDFRKADLRVMRDKSFIEELLPDDPIYIDLLPEEARAVIAKTHENTFPAQRLLESEGFAFNGEIDIFEAGPVLSCTRRNIRTIRQSRTAVTAVADFTEPTAEYLVCNTRGFTEFRAALTELVVLEKGKVQIRPETAKLLKIKEGDDLRYAPLKKGGAA